MDIDFQLINKILVLFINLTGVSLAFWTYSSNKKGRINQGFVFFVIPILFWINFYNLSYYMTNYYLSLFFLRLTFSFAFIFFIGFYYFSIIWLLNKKGVYIILGRIVFVVETFFAILCLFTGYIVSSARIGELGIIPVFTYGGSIIFHLSSIVLVLLIISIFIIEYSKMSSREKVKISYFLIGVLFFVLGTLIFGVIFPFLLNIYEYYNFANYSVIFLIVFSSYAIVKHELMGIKTLVTQVLIAIISIILLVDIIALTTDGSMRLLKVGVLITFLYLGRGLINSVKKEKKIAKKLEKANEKIRHYVDRLEGTNKNLEEGNEDLKALLDASDTVTENMDSKKIAQGVVDIIPKSLGHLGNRGGIYISYNREKKIIQACAITESSLVKKAKNLLGKSLEGHKDYIDDVDNLVAKTIREKKIFVGSKLEYFIAPTVGVNTCKMIQKVTGSKSFVSVPLYSRGNVTGVLLFVGTKDEKKISERDKNILYMFSSHIGNAIENARLYEQTNLQIKELARLNNDLGKANIYLKELLEMKNEFLHITSHQLRTPLTAIRGMVAMWADGDFDNLSKKETKKMINRILTSTDRLNNITNDMLDALELEGGFLKFQFVSTSLKKILEETVDTLKPNFEKKGIYVRLKVDSWIPDIDVEPNYIRQVFMNTIDNACKYTKNGGVDIYVKNNKNYLEVTIKDTGVGISKIDQKKMFEKFTRGKNASAENATGSGLGLFIAKKIVLAHGGKIEISSDGINKGSIVKIFLKNKHDK